MNRKISRITLLIPIITISIFIGGAVIMKTTSSLFHSINDSNFDSEETDVTSDYRVNEIEGIQACECLGNVYADTIPPEINLRSPPNNSLVLVNITFYIEISDDFPAMGGGVPFVPEYVLYNWNDATSNTTAYNANTDEPPADDEPVKIELTLPNDEEGATHILRIYAVDYEANWASLIFVCTTPGEGEESNVTWTTTIPTTTTERRRTDGFLLVPVIIALIGSVIMLSKKRTK